ncbi:FAD-dependent monooxygenase [Ramlibacter algicola]|uniref:FAD-dependent monooxygenase n=1 Tax=Ramlibacter algicola TaxID=2795217 RepID=A0A934Q333_9BURK|nr:FAD-dependent monooxygenase [Ramlibacter algicola]MBK0394258.1 FAD-dependent monooxygenase [Ramlibacter algicola]
MEQDVVVAGGGIGGIAAAIAVRRAGRSVQVLEQAAAFEEIGAGLQFGPNVTRIVQQWPQAWKDVQAAAGRPGALRVRDAGTGRELGRLRLGASFAERHGAPYFTMHRADAHAALLAQARADGAVLRAAERVDGMVQADGGVRVRTVAGDELQAAALLGADGLWSRVRDALLGDGAPAFTGHLAYRALLQQADLPAALRSQDIGVWLAPRMHAVAYPVRAGEALNLVCLIEGPAPGDAKSWNHEGVTGALHESTAGTHASLRGLLDAATQWRLWALHARAPVRSAGEMARGRVALLGDAAHPMLPYLAQGAGMAIEDAWTLQQALAGGDVEAALQRYATERWRRCARVQQRSLRNARIFHAGGLLRVGRDAAMRVVGEPLLDLPWLYGAC